MMRNQIFLNITLFLIVAVLPRMIFADSSTIKKQSCTSPIYCHGELLHMVQTAKIFNDSKTFVDMSMRHPVNQTLQHFDIFMRQTDYSPTTEQIREFVFENFETVGEMEDFYPRDFKPEPKFVKEVEDKKVREFLKKLIAIWPTLTRKISQQVFDKPEMFSVIPVKNAFIIPGGRFKEYYYWDTYWIIKGLLLSGMTETAKGVIDNFIHVVNTYGFVPNGGRIYYLNRSQPPVLTLMMKDYVKYTKDYGFLRENVKILEKELHWWLNKRISKIDKDGESYFLAHFDSESDTPRPESYLEDIETCSMHQESDQRHECYTDLKGGAESGWDFTSRWIFNDVGDPDSELGNIQTRRNIPVDLNSFLYKSFKFMYHFYVVFREPTDAKYWLNLADRTLIKAGSESGWDFTSRWIFNDVGDPDSDLGNIQTGRNTPVDLNSFLYKSFKFMHHFYVVFREPTDAKYSLNLADRWSNAIEKVLYHEEDGIWYDFDIKTQKHRRHFAASNFAPLWADAVPEEEKVAKGNRAVKYLNKHGWMNFHGVPSTLIDTGLQWDYPNAWAPYQNMIIFGLERSGSEEAQEVAKIMAHKWIQSNIIAFDENKVVFEKLNALSSGQFGGGGEYHIQSGFGWTNGSLMEIIDYYFRIKNRKYVGMQDDWLSNRGGVK